MNVNEHQKRERIPCITGADFCRRFIFDNFSRAGRLFIASRNFKHFAVKIRRFFKLRNVTAFVENDELRAGDAFVENVARPRRGSSPSCLPQMISVGFLISPSRSFEKIFLAVDRFDQAVDRVAVVRRRRAPS